MSSFYPVVNLIFFAQWTKFLSSTDSSFPKISEKLIIFEKNINLENLEKPMNSFGAQKHSVRLNLLVENRKTVFFEKNNFW